jgi:hypothetical protein
MCGGVAARLLSLQWLLAHRQKRPAAVMRELGRVAIASVNGHLVVDQPVDASGRGVITITWSERKFPRCCG